MAERSRILVVDDEPQITRVLKTTLQAQGYEVKTAADGEAALNLSMARGCGYQISATELKVLKRSAMKSAWRWFLANRIVLPSRSPPATV